MSNCQILKMNDTVGTSTLLCSSQFDNRHQMAEFTAQTNLGVWMMAPPQLQDIWLHHLKIYSNTFIFCVPHSLTGLKYLTKNEICWEEKTDKILVMPRGVTKNYFSKMLFDSIIFVANSTKAAPMGCFTRHHNLWSEGCLITTAGSPQCYPAHPVSRGDHLKSSQFALTGYLVVMRTSVNCC